MRFRRTKIEAPIIDSGDFARWEGEIAAGYEREYGLGFTPSDMMRCLKRLGWGTKIQERKQIKHLNAWGPSFDERIQNFLTGMDSLVDEDQLAAIHRLSISAGTALRSDDDSFKQGYLFYIAAVTETDKLFGRFPLQYGNITQDLERTETYRGLKALEKGARENVPIIAGNMYWLYELSYNPLTLDDPWLARAGIGLAFEQCCQHFRSTEETAMLARETEASLMRS